MIIRANDRPQEVHDNYSGGQGRITFTALLPDEALLKGEGRFFKTMAFAPGASIGEHVHSGNIALYIILAGHGIAIDDGQTVPVQRGDVLYTTDGDSHGLRDGGDGSLVVLACVLLENKAK